MKLFGKIVLFLIIIIPIIFCYSTIKSLWNDNNEGNDSNNYQDDYENENYSDMEDAINDIEGESQTLAGEEFISKIGNPISKISEGGEINISVANVYQDADEKSEVLGTLKKYDIVTSQAYPGGWSRIKTDGLSGWMLTKYITLSSDSGDVSIVTLKGSKALVNVSGLNVRAAASTSGKILNTFSENTEVKIIDVSDDGEWCKVQWQDIEGWVMKKFLTIK